MESERTLPVLNAEELRVLGALMEKSKTTPDYYPMTVNALAAACNQKTSRKPVVDYSEETVINAIHSLKSRSLVATAVGGTSRAVKYKHNFTTVYPLSNAELAILCLLFLRGPQTPGELNTNSGRLHEFSSLEGVHDALNKLMEANFVTELSKRPGQKEARFTHLLGDTVNMDEDDSSEESYTRSSSPGLEARVSALENEVTQLKDLINKIVNPS
ncbi:MAG: hypothetical protein K0S32_3440 [Bacteroidetes bacterium]|jgi:uncharacterized protein YceH (UPF0502 family)|nr:hypothetical protein [Bacteroidota bacterium]